MSPAPSRGPGYLYVLPSAQDELLKLGISRDPLQRMQAFHRRWYEFFDLDAALLVETETTRDARELELALGRRMRLHQAPMPMAIRSAAGGHTEWYRGALELLAQEARALAGGGYTVHEPLRPWARRALEARADQVYSWAAGALDQASLRTGPGGLPNLTPAEHRLIRDALDAYPALEIALEPLLPAEVWAWYASGSASFDGSNPPE